ncbi:unnamed protein product [Periconia digitata]|uniref:Uncharacterized protein n=1 Tax=Periconia digitata TaxID=1303443 RepID=A0A9W4XLI3_9PLEO|nr:unnamed protein product [Periconia digitata]
MNVNLRGVFACLKYQLRSIVDGGSIVNVASAAGTYGGPMISPYIAAKHGVVGLSKAAAYEYADRSIRVNAVCPGWTDTVLAQEFIESLNGLITPNTVPQLFKHFAKPEDVAGIIVFLLSDDSKFATKGVFAIDGGYVA